MTTPGGPAGRWPGGPGGGNLPGLVAPGILDLQPYVPGKPLAELERELGLRHSIKLASNENPLGPSPRALAAITPALAELGLYPDGAGFEVKAALARHLSVGADQITLGNGSNEVLVLLAETLLGPGREAVCSAYAFLVYELAIRATSARARVARALPPDNARPLGHDLAAMARLVGDDTRLVFVANPNNPTGTWLDAGELQAFIAGLPPHVIAVVDEAYAEYVTWPDYESVIGLVGEFPNLVVTRTFSKIYGLAGLRIGYAISHPELAAVLNRVRQPFNVNSIAQVAALGALGDQDHVEKSRALNKEGLSQLQAGLAAFGWKVPPSAGNFVLADTGGSGREWYQWLLTRGIIVRPMENYGLERHLRITVGLPEQNARLLAAVAAIKAGDGVT